MPWLPLEVRNKHDQWGNCAELLDPKDKEKIDDGDYYRASGEVVCSCGKPYWKHDDVLGALWLKRLCNGDFVHL